MGILGGSVHEKGYYYNINNDNYINTWYNYNSSKA